MILTDREIQMALLSEAIVIEPKPPEMAYSSTSVDLTLDKTLNIFLDATPGIEMVLDPSKAGYTHEQVLTERSRQVAIGAEGYTFEPRHMILAWTIERVELPVGGKLAARVEGKSSLARLGLSVHLTAPTIHAGFSGQIRLEMINHGKLPIRLRTGMKICQLIFEMTTGTPVSGYKGRFAGQTAGTKTG